VVFQRRLDQGLIVCLPVAELPESIVVWRDDLGVGLGRATIMVGTPDKTYSDASGEVFEDISVVLPLVSIKVAKISSSILVAARLRQ
jgi:hypothetical protein